MLLTIGWIVTLLTCALPNVLWQEITGAVPGWLFWARLGVLVCLVLAGSIWKVVSRLRPYVVMLLVLTLAEHMPSLVGRIPQWQNWFGGPAPSFVTLMLETQILRLGIALIMLAGLLMMYHDRSDFFLVKGRLDAPVKPVRWLGVSGSERWSRFGRILTFCISGGTLAFLLIAAQPSTTALTRVFPLVPALLVLAAMNAFSEELNYRAALLAPLHRVVGARQALLMTAVFFGIGHFYGVPYGIIGVLMAGFLGWLLGKSMLETRGFFWAWFIHFWQDVLIFTFMALGSIVAGGR